jgi:S-DNA-T family DNA segregation ATPase FtsK/SpoIIIE
VQEVRQYILKGVGRMLFELFSTGSMAVAVGASYYFQHGLDSDHTKIERIAFNAGLYVTEDKKKRSIRIYRKSKRDGYTEYAYKIPLGLSFADFEAKAHKFTDGLNNRSNREITFGKMKQLKNIDIRKDIPKQLKNIFTEVVPTNKSIEMKYDGMLVIRVFDKKLPDNVPYEELAGKCKGWQVPVGVTLTKQIKHDFEAMPHLIVAGTTRYGKTVFLKNVVTTLINNKPDEVTFTLIDLKTGLAFNRFSKAKQVQTVALDAESALVALKAVKAEMEAKQIQYLNAGYEDVQEAKHKRRHFIIIDEGAELSSAGLKGDDKATKAECERLMAHIARVGGGLGYRMIFATQYPTADTLPRQVKQNADARLCFRLQSEIASQVVLGEGNVGAKFLPKKDGTHKGGRGIYLTDREVTVQTPYISNSYIDTVITPNINIRPRKDDTFVPHAKKADSPRRKHTLVVEET